MISDRQTAFRAPVGASFLRLALLSFVAVVSEQSLAAAQDAKVEDVLAQNLPKTPSEPLAELGSSNPAVLQMQGPITLDLQPSEDAWTKVCGKDPNNQEEVCYTTRNFVLAPDRPTPVWAVAIYQFPGERNLGRFILPLALQLPPGFLLTIDRGAPIRGYFTYCLLNGCFAKIELTSADIAALKEAQTISLEARDRLDKPLTFKLPMKGFAATFASRGIDPEALRQQQQEEKQRKASDKIGPRLREKIEEMRD